MWNYFNRNGALEGIPTRLALTVTKAGLAVSFPAATFVLCHMLQGQLRVSQNARVSFKQCTLFYNLLNTFFIYLSANERDGYSKKKIVQQQWRSGDEQICLTNRLSSIFLILRERNRAEVLLKFSLLH